MNEGDTGYGACFGENNSEVGSETAWLFHGTIQATSATSVMLT